MNVTASLAVNHPILTNRQASQTPKVSGATSEISTGPTLFGGGSKVAGLSKSLGVERALPFGPLDLEPTRCGSSASFKALSSWSWAVAASKRIFSASLPLATTVRIMEFVNVELDRCRCSWYDWDGEWLGCITASVVCTGLTPIWEPWLFCGDCWCLVNDQPCWKGLVVSGYWLDWWAWVGCLFTVSGEVPATLCSLLGDIVCSSSSNEWAGRITD